MALKTMSSQLSSMPSSASKSASPFVGLRESCLPFKGEASGTAVVAVSGRDFAVSGRDSTTSQVVKALLAASLDVPLTKEESAT
eukprot:CAMPEP_0197693676 /NCGR_PEP_ID=MMETSP1338-20131121/112844_1 /TAXON_ID=43686 ORGANISM="Pelagodinium beii, Strain RCC1491" /NCGR_SAMPLE_ID=MMETSP1338 /ASSEMBLY_ACC=CAM_ASM_000754 /LENGTH=83 /DNA_ID=CAMNT_0043276455 /DNA_START=202 /DNA_END=453 /DNA_ORIENTATION=+